MTSITLERRPVTIETTLSNHDPIAFFQTREGLHVSEAFMLWMELSGVGCGRHWRPVTLFSYDLDVRTRSDGPSSIPGDSLFDETELCARMEQLITEQPNGEEGNLHIDPHHFWNIFKVPGGTVGLMWDSEWSVHFWAPRELMGAAARGFSHS